MHGGVLCTLHARVEACKPFTPAFNRTVWMRQKNNEAQNVNGHLHMDMSMYPFDL